MISREESATSAEDDSDDELLYADHSDVAATYVQREVNSHLDDDNRTLETLKK